MTKKQKLETFDAVEAELTRYRQAVNAMANDDLWPTVTRYESAYGGEKGNSYKYQFFESRGGYLYAIVTFRCVWTGQRDTVDVIPIEAILRDTSGNAYHVMLRSAFYEAKSLKLSREVPPCAVS